MCSSDLKGLKPITKYTLTLTPILCENVGTKKTLDFVPILCENVGTKKTLDFVLIIYSINDLWFFVFGSKLG